MYIRFKTFGPLRRVIGEREVSLEVPDASTISSVIERIIDRWGSHAEELIMDNGQVSGNLIIMLNMKDVFTLDGLNTTIQPNDEVTILPHVQGG